MFSHFTRCVAAGICFWALPAFAQDAPEITLRLTPAQAAAIVDAMDARGRLPVMAPPAWGEVEGKLGKALDADPKFRSAYEEVYQPLYRRTNGWKDGQ